MTKKQQKILDKQIQYLCEYDLETIKAIREVVRIGQHKTFLNEVETIESLFERCLQNRKEVKSTFYFASTGGWTLQYFPKKLKYKKNEDFKLQIFFSFVAIDNFD